MLAVALMEMKLGTNVFGIVSMTTTYYLNNYIYCSLRHLLLHSSNLLTAAHMEIKLGTHAYYHDDNKHFSIIIIINFYRGLAPFHRDNT